MAIKTERFVDPFDSPAERRGAWRLGMWLFIVVVAMVFCAGIMGYAVVRLDDSGAWRPKGSPGLPSLLLVSTALVGVVSWAHVMALRAARRDRRVECARDMMVALAGSIAFLVVQAAAWWQLVRENLRVDESLYAYTFYVLTGLHALHVIGGLPSLAVVTRRAMHRRYGRDDTSGIELSGLYWHTLAIVWVALYVTLWIGS